MGDQLHSEISDRANAAFRAQFREEGLPLDEDTDMVAQIGVQAGLHAALQILSERGWIRIEVQP
jgi:hypothetical protein